MEILEPKLEMEKLKTSEKNSKVAVIILLNKNPVFKNFMRAFDLEIYGKKMWKYVELACSDYDTKTTVCTPEINIIPAIKPMLTNKKWTMVLFSDTPLIQKTTLAEIITFCEAREINAINLERGFVFNTEYLKTIDKIQNSLIEKFGNGEDFLTINNPFQFERVAVIMKKRILDFHIQNGIILHDKASTFIDADVILESGVVVFPNNVVKGKSFIGKNTILESGNTIQNSIIKENCLVQNSFIKNAKIEAETVLEAVNINNKG